VSWANHLRRYDRIGTTRGSQRPVNRVPGVFAAAETRRTPASVYFVMLSILSTRVS
jgi:hypothetical protein